MNYQEFLEYIKENLAAFYEQNIDICREWSSKDCQDQTVKESGKEEEEHKEQEQYEVLLHKVVKNNGIVLDAVALHSRNQRISPNIYLKPYYDSYQMGKPLDLIMAEIVCQYQREKEEGEIDYVDILDFKAVKSKIVIRLVNYERNKEQLKDCPHKKYLDLAITFRYVAYKDGIGIASSLISNAEFDAWNIGLEELYRIALFNTMQEFPWHMDSLATVIYNCFKNRMPEGLSPELLEEIKESENRKSGVSMYVLTNDTGIHGAACMLYDNVIRNFAKVQDANIFILPSSVHEVMLVPEDEEIEAQFLATLVEDANRSSVGLIDLLSDHIYYYDREREQITIYGPC